MADVSSFIDVLRRRWWWVTELSAVVLVAATGLYMHAVSPRLSESEMRERAAVLLAAEMEEATASEHEAHGHTLAPGQRMLCAVEVFGTDPQGPGRERSLKTVYGYYLCASGGPGTPFLAAMMTGGPAALHLDAERPEDRLITTTMTGDFEAEIVAMLPERYRVQAKKGFTTSGPPAALRARFEREVTAAS